MRLASKLVVGALLLLALAVVVLLFSWTGKSSTANIPSNREQVVGIEGAIPKESAFSGVNSLVKPVDASGTNSETKVSNNLVFLVEVCEDPSTEPSTECWNVLEQHFQSKQLGHSWIKLENPITYGQIFENPNRYRERVFESLEKIECRLEGSQLVRYDLNEYCDAEALISFAKYLSFCNFPASYDISDEWFVPIPGHPIFALKSRFQMRLDNIEHVRQTNLERYEHLKQSIWEELFEIRWRQSMCSQFSELGIDPERDKVQYDLIQQIGARLGEDRKFGGTRSEEVDVLLSLAARFGNEYASIYYVSSDPSWTEHIHNIHPWKRLIYDVLAKKNLTVETRLRVGIETVIALEDANVDFDWVWLVEKICGHRNNRTNCQAAFIALQESKSHTGFRKSKILDKLESLAIEQGMYD